MQGALSYSQLSLIVSSVSHCFKTAFRGCSNTRECVTRLYASLRTSTRNYCAISSIGAASLRLCTRKLPLSSQGQTIQSARSTFGAGFLELARPDIGDPRMGAIAGCSLGGLIV